VDLPPVKGHAPRDDNDSILLGLNRWPNERMLPVQHTTQQPSDATYHSCATLWFQELSLDLSENLSSSMHAFLPKFDFLFGKADSGSSLLAIFILKELDEVACFEGRNDGIYISNRDEFIDTIILECKAVMSRQYYNLMRM
jgi:hypothetical protein